MNTKETRFNEQEHAQLAALTETIKLTKEHLNRAEALRVDELPLTDYERSIVQEYRGQLRSLIKLTERLMDARLDKAADADQRERAFVSSYELLHALQREMGAIIERYYIETFGAQ
ncbi:MAG: hypothetical protein QOH39_3035 [Verrucomicrobiota bacterium]|jgi:hypothetical protein